MVDWGTPGLAQGSLGITERPKGAKTIAKAVKSLSLVCGNFAYLVERWLAKTFFKILILL